VRSYAKRARQTKTLVGDDDDDGDNVVIHSGGGDEDSGVGVATKDRCCR
jgi:hypothetical protein